jgi:tetratricopeptide (TPR) repeat protein
VVVIGMAAAPALACLWDYDTLRDERRGLPGIAEVLAGKWERHSPFFYADRAARMRRLIERDPADWAAYDNLAVALEKLGRFDEAIAVMADKERLNPGQYTTYANLGTFYLHKGELAPGIAYIRQALAINPAAHFGRETYQLKLAEFLRAGRDDPRLLTSQNFLGIAGGKRVDAGWSGELATQPATRPATAATAADVPATGPPTRSSNAGDEIPERQYWAMRGGPGQLRELGLDDDVFDGIVGMIRFGTGTSAELYLALGDLLALRGDKHLAYRAYQRALDLNHPRRAYLTDVMDTLRDRVQDKAEFAPEKIAAERAAADAWVAAYQKYEDDLIRAGKNPDDEANLAGFYAASGKAVVPEPATPADWLPRNPAAQVALVVVAVLGSAAALLIALAVRFWRRRRRRRSRRVSRPAAAP